MQIRETHFNVLVHIVGSLDALFLWDPDFIPDILQPDLGSVEVGAALRCMHFTGHKRGGESHFLSAQHLRNLIY